MLKLWIMILVAAAVIAPGAVQGAASDDDDPGDAGEERVGVLESQDTESDDDTSGEATNEENGGPEAAARKVFEALKEQDTDVLLDLIDFRKMYDKTPPEERTRLRYKDFETIQRGRLTAAFHENRQEGLDYEILGAVTYITVRVKPDADAEWEEIEVPIRNVDGTWKVSSEWILEALAGSGAEETARRILEGVKNGDRKPLMEHLDLKGLYEMQVPEELREETSYEDFEKEFFSFVEDSDPPEGFDYEILGSEKKGDLVIVTVRIKEDEDADWEQEEMEFKRMVGKWKITAEGMQKMMDD